MNIQRIDGPGIRLNQEASVPTLFGYYWFPDHKQMAQEVFEHHHGLRRHMTPGYENEAMKVLLRAPEDTIRQLWMDIVPPQIPQKENS